MKVQENKTERLGLRMSKEDLEWLEVARRVMGYRSRAEVVRALVRMVVSPVKTEALKRGVSLDEVLNTIDTHLLEHP